MKSKFTALAALAAIAAIPGTALTTPAFAQTTPAHYTTGDTLIGTLLDDPAAKAVLDQYLPGLASNPQIEMARGMSLKAIQQFASDQITDQKLADIDAALAKLPAK